MFIIHGPTQEGDTISVSCTESVFPSIAFELYVQAIVNSSSTFLTIDGFNE